MKSFLLFLILFTFLYGKAAEPTISASNVRFTAIDGNRFTLSCDAGNGNARIIVVKEGSKITGTPVDGMPYTSITNQSDARFEVPGTEFSAPGEYVVYKGTASVNISVTNLKAGTTYYVAIFEYNTTGTPSPDYSPVTPVDKNVTTVSAPVNQAVITSFSSVTGNSLRVNWTNGSGASRIVVGKKGTSLTALPVDFKAYNYNQSFGSNTSATYTLDAETFVLVNTNGSSYVDVSNLEPNTTYTFAIFEYNGSNNPVYLKPTVAVSRTTNTGPSQPSTALNFSAVDGNRLDMSWNKGNGSHTLIVVKKGGPVVNVPENGKTYAASTTFNTPASEWYPNSGEYVINASTAAQLSLTGLEKSTLYYFAIFVFDVDANGYKYYYGTPFTKNQSTAKAPTSQTTVSVSNITGSSAQLAYTWPASGYGDSRLLVIKDGGPVDFVPTDLVKHNSFTAIYGQGELVATDTYVLYGQTNGGAPIVTGLKPGHTYHVALFEMNGTNAPVYKIPGATAIINVPNEPTTPSRDAGFPTVEGNSIRFDWTKGDGAQRIVIARKGSPVTTLPQDGVIYSADAQYKAGTEMSLGSGEFVVYNNTGTTVTITGLEKATTYHFAVFEYNLKNGVPDYLTTVGKWFATSKATLAAPVTQVADLNTGTIQSTQATITFKVGSGNSRLFVMREGSAVNTEPEDLKMYANGGGSFGIAATDLGGGNYVVGVGNLSGFTVSNLKAGTQYYITAFEANGSGAPVYLKPGATQFSFTTTGGIPLPTQAAHSPLFENIDGNKFSFKWTNGDGANRIVVARKGSAVSFIPVNGQDYNANNSFSNGVDLGSGQYVVYKGSSNNVELTNLELSTTYHFAVFEYNGSAATSRYLVTNGLIAQGSSAAAPTAAATLIGSTINANTITLNWNKGNGDGRLVIMKEGSEVTAAPVNLTTYSSNVDFKNAPQLAVGQYIVYAGTGSAITVTGLEPGKNYHFAVFEYNGSSGPVYNTSTFLKAMVITTPLPVTWVSFSATSQGGNVILDWLTAQEINNSNFEVERSSDGINYHKIGDVKPNTRHVYQFIDVQSLNATAFYRIKQLDYDGTIAYSKTIKVNASDKMEVIRLLQNPVREQLKVQATQAVNGGWLRIFSADGKALLSQSIFGNWQVVDLSSFKKGIYYLQVFTKQGEKQITLPFIKD